MESKKINQLATELAPDLSDLTIIGDPTTGISKKITLSQMASLFTGTVEEYANFAAFPLVGVADTIYIAKDTNVIYRWDSTAYVVLSPNIIASLVFNDANGFDGTIALVGSVATLTITTALTSGSVPFIGASGALTQDNSNLFFDDTNNRLGIATASPTTPLDVFGSGIIGRLNATSTNNAYLGFASAGTNKWSVGNVQSDHRFRIFSEANSAELITILQTGEFGIGIANPTTKFHIDGAASALIANLDANVSVAKSLSFRSDNSNRINLEVSGTESGSNVGADFFLRTFTDAGSLIETPFTIVRSTGVTTIKSLTLTNVLSVANGGTGSATQNFVDLTTTQSIGGAKTFTSALVGTSATFSANLEAGKLGGAVTVGDLFVDSANSSVYVGRQSSTSGDNSKFYVRNRVNTLTALSVDPGGNGAVDVVGTFSTTRGTNLATATGNVGIGTSTPTAITGFTSVCVNNATTGGFFEAQQGGTVLSRYGAQNDISFIDTVANIPFIIKTNSTERMRITSGGKVMVNTTDSGVNALLYASASSSEPYPLGSKATTSSQGLVGFFDSANALQGSISISGSTVSYNSFMGSHWSQLSDNSKSEILIGTILEAIDELCEWDNITDERLPKVKISDIVESKNVYGVFSNWDNTDDYNDMYVAAVGAGFIRVNSNEIVSMGDLLQSNGDGTAKIQSDDIMRSSTIAKVTSTQKINTYEDGSYLIAATLHCG